MSALSAATYISHARRGAFCPLLADGYYHPSPTGHQLVSELLLLLLARQISPLLAAAPTPAALAAAAAPSLSRARQDERARAGEGGYLADPGRSGHVGPAVRWSDIPPLVRRPPCLLGASKTELGGASGAVAPAAEAREGACAVSEAVGHRPTCTAGHRTLGRRTPSWHTMHMQQRLPAHAVKAATAQSAHAVAAATACTGGCNRMCTAGSNRTCTAGCNRTCTAGCNRMCTGGCNRTCTAGCNRMCARWPSCSPSRACA